MSQSAGQADAFFREVVAHGEVFAIRDDSGFPAPVNREGERAMPFWSSRRRAEKVVKATQAYEDFVVVALSLTSGVTVGYPELRKMAYS